MTWQYNPERGDITDPDVPQEQSGCQEETYAYYGGEVIAETVTEANAPLLANAPAMLDLLKKLYARIESGYLVRNTLEDSGPTFHMDALEFVLELKKTQELIERIEKKIMTGTELIAAERQRQIEVEGWSPEHDDEHDDAELASAALCYTVHANHQVQFPSAAPLSTEMYIGPTGRLWPWSPDWFKPSGDPIRNLVKAGALIAAEIDRLQRIKDKDQRALETKQHNVGGVK